MDPSPDRIGPDLRPWDRALAQRVQPVLSALFHDLMSPLTLLKSRIYLVRQQLLTMAGDPEVPQDTQKRLLALADLLDGIEEAGNRIHRGMAVPRDAIWATLLENEPMDPSEIIDRIGTALRSPEEGQQEEKNDREEVAGTR